VKKAKMKRTVLGLVDRTRKQPQSTSCSLVKGDEVTVLSDFGDGRILVTLDPNLPERREFNISIEDVEF